VEPIDVSVILPVFNSRDTLDDCLRAILSQSGVSLEVIAVDDGSTDDSPALLEAVAAQDIRLHVLHQANAGVWQARLTGVAASRGSYVICCDADDLPRPGMYASMVKRANETCADVVVSAYRRMDAVDGRELATEMVARPQGTLAPSDDPRGFACVNTALWNKLFNGDVLRQVVTNLMGADDGGRSLRLPTRPRVMEDALLLACGLPYLRHVEFVTQPLYDYRVRPGASMATLRLDELDGLADDMRAVRAWLPGGLHPVCDVMAFVHLGVSALSNLAVTQPGQLREYEATLRTTMRRDFPLYWRRGRDTQAGPTRLARLRLAVALLLFRCHLLGWGWRWFAVLSRVLRRQGRW